MSGNVLDHSSIDTGNVLYHSSIDTDNLSRKIDELQEKIKFVYDKYGRIAELDEKIRLISKTQSSVDTGNLSSRMNELEEKTKCLTCQSKTTGGNMLNVMGDIQVTDGSYSLYQPSLGFTNFKLEPDKYNTKLRLGNNNDTLNVMGSIQVTDGSYSLYQSDGFTNFKLEVDDKNKYNTKLELGNNNDTLNVMGNLDVVQTGNSNSGHIKALELTTAGNITGKNVTALSNVTATGNITGKNVTALNNLSISDGNKTLLTLKKDDTPTKTKYGKVINDDVVIWATSGDLHFDVGSIDPGCPATHPYMREYGDDQYYCYSEPNGNMTGEGEICSCECKNVGPDKKGMCNSNEKACNSSDVEPFCGKVFDPNAADGEGKPIRMCFGVENNVPYCYGSDSDCLWGKHTCYSDKECEEMKNKGRYANKSVTCHDTDRDENFDEWHYKACESVATKCHNTGPKDKLYRPFSINYNGVGQMKTLVSENQAVKHMTVADTVHYPPGSKKCTYKEEGKGCGSSLGVDLPGIMGYAVDEIDPAEGENTWKVDCDNLSPKCSDGTSMSHMFGLHNLYNKASETSTFMTYADLFSA